MSSASTPIYRSLRLACWASCTLFLFGLAGCSFGSEEVATLVNACVADDDCVQGVCDQGICIDDSAREVSIAIEVLRASSDTLRTTPVSWAFEPESISGSNERDYTLPATRQVVGTVRWQGVPVPASMRFTRRTDASASMLPAVPVQVDILREVTDGGGAESVDYTTVLARGGSYDVLVLPTIDPVETADQVSAAAIRSLPPIYTSVQLDGDVDGGPFRFDISFPETLDELCAENELFGCTLTGTVLSFDGANETAAVGLQVRAVEKESGRLVSSIGETTGLGDFAIRVAADAAPYTIRVTSGSASGPFPSVSVDPDLAFINDPGQRRIYVPRVDGVQVTGAVRDEEKRAVQGATVRFSSNGIFEESALGLEGSFAASTTTSDDGSFSVMLLPGVYAVTVTPPTDTANVWAPLSGEAFVVDDVAALGDLVLPSQIAFSGSCTTFAGEPARGVTVLAQARGDMGGLQRSRLTASNLEGDFRLTVDAGRYDMLIKVAGATGFPWLVEPELVMSAERGEISRDYTLPPPIVVRGTLRSDEGAPVGGAPIRAYILESGGGEARPIQVAETLSADDGSYELLISPDLGE